MSESIKKPNELYSLISINKAQGPSSFEDAVRKTGFGKFNIMLMVLAFCGIFSPMFETTTMSYIFAPAKCDLDLSLQDKGYLNSAVFAGMISSSFIWGFLLDTFGRRRLMIVGYFMDATVVFLSSLSQNFTMLIICKFLGGAIINGPFSAMIAYLSEFHSSKYRSRIQLMNGTLTSLAQIVLPLLAWGILPLPIHWTSHNFTLNSWNIFLMLTGLAPFISGIIFFFLPESPKYLMTSGENEKAMEVLQTVYSWNTGKPPETYPIKELIQEIPSNKTEEEEDDEDDVASVIDHKSKLYAVNEGLQNFAPLFRSPYLGNFLLIAVIEVMFLTSLNMLRLWMPQLFQALEDYKMGHNGSTTDLCTMLEVLKPSATNGTCVAQNVSKSSVYINSMLVSSLSISCYILTASVIVRVGKKKVLICLAFVGAISCMSLYIAKGTVLTTVLTSVFVSCGNVGSNVVLAITVDVFPTTLRAFTVSLIMAIARLGITCGNLIFPMLLKAGCAPPFFVVGGAVAVGGILSFLLPNTENRALQ
ncbi:unnamed protein product [Phyllotreta striolata]|uniref:Major facilitator superfamily (MFS) profile domain-containing protein n=1 Tax=Phyllotreta striolata TaxID=444603 RepID=A0A9P0DV63_PHYSR|nr:unnamed protein product [Phyllotreta striolata]